MIHAAATIKSNIKLIIQFSLLCMLCAGTVLNTYAKNTETDLVLWGSDEGMARFSRAEAKIDFFKLANHFESQNNKIYCGVASSVIVLNALRVRNDKKEKLLPRADSVLSEADRQYIPVVFSPFFDRYTQDNVFTENTKSKLEILGKPINKKRDIGMQLAQLQGLLESHQLKVQKKVVNESVQIESIRKDFINNLKQKDDYILVNYLRETLNQPGGGHISPVAAYDTQSDSVLVMDVNSNKEDWVWVSLTLLVASMATFDTLENRGYLLISDN